MKRQLGDLEFKIARWDVNKKELEWSNIFGYYWIQWGVARYRTMSQRELSMIRDPFFFIFADTWSRCEWEMEINGFLEDRDSATKIDVYSLSLKPNERLLMDMINSVSIKSCRDWLRENKR